MKRPSKLELFRGTDDRRYWHMVAHNGRVLSDGSQGYHDNEARRRGIIATAASWDVDLSGLKFPGPGESIALTAIGTVNPRDGRMRLLMVELTESDLQPTLIIVNSDPPRRRRPSRRSRRSNG